MHQLTFKVKNTCGKAVNQKKNVFVVAGKKCVVCILSIILEAAGFHVVKNIPDNKVTVGISVKNVSAVSAEV